MVRKVHPPRDYKKNPYKGGAIYRKNTSIAARSRRGTIPGYTRKAGYYGRFTGSHPEMKYRDTTINWVPLGTSWNGNSPNLVPMGNEANDRVGRKITIKSLCIRYLATMPSQTDPGNTDENVRIMVIQDMQSNGAFPQDATLFADPTDFQSYMNLENSGRFKILATREFDINCMGGSYNGSVHTWASVSKSGEIYIGGLNMPIEFDSSTQSGAMTSVRTNNIIIIACSKSGLVSCKWTSRIRYTDF